MDRRLYRGARACVLEQARHHNGRVGWCAGAETREGRRSRARPTLIASPSFRSGVVTLAAGAFAKPHPLERAIGLLLFVTACGRSGRGNGGGPSLGGSAGGNAENGRA